MKNSLLKLAFAAAAFAAAIAFGTPQSHAGQYGNSPWCAVVDEGAGEMLWECEYDSAEDCVPAVLQGNRGFCQRNPYWRG
jgi:hypothetical protein